MFVSDMNIAWRLTLHNCTRKSTHIHLHSDSLRGSAAGDASRQVHTRRKGRASGNARKRHRQYLLHVCHLRQ